jgi:hypothetical protein
MLACRFTMLERELHALRHKLRVSTWAVPNDDWASAQALIHDLQVIVPAGAA